MSSKFLEKQHDIDDDSYKLKNFLIVIGLESKEFGYSLCSFIPASIFQMRHQKISLPRLGDS